MAIIPKILDPIKGLVDYTLEIKPYHTKIIEILEENIHTDILNVIVTDEIEFCINFGIPNLNTIFAFDISSIDFSNNSIIVNKDATKLIHSGQRISIEFSVLNNNQYYVNDVIYDPISNTSEIFVVENIISDIADGQVVHSVISYCPDGINKSTNVHPLPEIKCFPGYGDVYDSFVSIVLLVDVPNNSIIINGDHRLELDNTSTVTLINEDLYVPNTSNDIVGLFHIDSYSFDGNDTIIKVVETISGFPSFNISDQYKLLITYLGYDQFLTCDLSDHDNSETLFVSMKEELSFDISLNYNDDFVVYNLENSYETKYDNLGIGTISSFIQPIIVESLTAPISPTVFDIWFDLNKQVLKQWFNYNWVSVKYIYWYQEDLVNDQKFTYYKLIKNKFADSGWLEVNPILNDNLSLRYDLDPYSTTKNNYFHPTRQIVVDQPLNGLILTGGDFTHLLLHNQSIKSYDDISFIGDLNHVTYSIDSYGTNSIQLSQSSGDLTNIFVAGISFRIEDQTLQNNSFNVVSSMYNGTNTIVSVVENLNQIIFQNQIIGNIPGIFYVQPNVLSGINQVSTLYISNQPINVDTKLIEYQYNGPLQLTTNIFQDDNNIGVSIAEDIITNDLLITPNNSTTGDQFVTSFLDDITWSWGDISTWFQYYILSFPNNNEISINGNASTDIQVGQQIRIIGNTPNAGLYLVNVVFYNGINTLITINETIDQLELGGYIEPSNILPIRILLEDKIGVSMIESTSGGLLDTSGNMIQSLDYEYFDIGGFDSANPTNLN